MLTAHMDISHRSASTSLSQPECRVILGALLGSNIGIQAAVVGTADGRVVAHAAQPGKNVEPARIAAIASSMLALSESFSREALNSKPQYSSVATAQGAIIIVRVPAAAQVLCLWADNSENFGMILHFALDAASQLGAAIEARSAH